MDAQRHELAHMSIFDCSVLHSSAVDACKDRDRSVTTLDNFGIERLLRYHFHFSLAMFVKVDGGHLNWSHC